MMKSQQEIRHEKQQHTFMPHIPQTKRPKGHLVCLRSKKKADMMQCGGLKRGEAAEERDLQNAYHWPHVC